MTRDNLTNVVLTLHQGGVSSIPKLKNLNLCGIYLIGFILPPLSSESKTLQPGNEGTTYHTLPVGLCGITSSSTISETSLRIMPPVQGLLEYYEKVSWATSIDILKHSTAYTHVAWPFYSELLAGANSPASWVTGKELLATVGERSLNRITHVVGHFGSDLLVGVGPILGLLSGFHGELSTVLALVKSIQLTILEITLWDWLAIFYHHSGCWARGAVIKVSFQQFFLYYYRYHHGILWV